MSADVLALAAGAASAYVRVRGPWRTPSRAIWIEPTPFTAWCTVRESHPGKHGEAVLFNPLPRKEKPMPTPPPEPRSSEFDVTFDALEEILAVLRGINSLNERRVSSESEEHAALMARKRALVERLEPGFYEREAT
jgi:hypothetical protein